MNTSRPWLPARLSGASRVASLSPAEKIKLTHVEMGAYAHLFRYVEEFIAPKMVSLARDFQIDNREAFGCVHPAHLQVALARGVPARAHGHLETLRAFRGLSEADADRAIDDLIDLVGAVDGLLATQAKLDVENLARYLGRPLGRAEQQDILARVMAAKRYTFIESGVTHPNFQELFGMVTTPAQQEKVGKALSPVLAPAA